MLSLRLQSNASKGCSGKVQIQSPSDKSEQREGRHGAGHTRVPRSPEVPANVPAAGWVSSLGLSNSLLHLLKKRVTKLVPLQTALGQVLLTAEPCKLAVQLRLASRAPP